MYMREKQPGSKPCEIPAFLVFPFLLPSFSPSPPTFLALRLSLPPSHMLYFSPPSFFLPSLPRLPPSPPSSLPPSLPPLPPSGWPQYCILRGHRNRVNHLLYPNANSSAYHPHYLLSGGAGAVNMCCCGDESH